MDDGSGQRRFSRRPMADKSRAEEIQACRLKRYGIQAIVQQQKSLNGISLAQCDNEG